MEEHIYILFIDSINETDILLKAVIIHENKVKKKFVTWKVYAVGI